MTELPSATALEHALGRAGMSLAHLRREAEAIALFGSRAGGCAGAVSDWDLLCIGRGRSQKLGAVDLVWVEPRVTETQPWLGGDLSGHVAAYGQWVHGGPRWELAAVDFARAAQRKEARLARYLRALGGAWSLMGPAYQDKHAASVQNDVRRWTLLLRGLPVPPSAQLPDPWTGGAAAGRSYERVLIELGAPLTLARELAGRS